MPTIALSEAAVSLLRLHIRQQGQIDVNETNRESYRELERAGLVMLGRPFTGEPRYHLTPEGFERKAEFTAPLP
jgi:hypothetical protein